MINASVFHNQLQDNEVDYASLASWVYRLNKLLKQILDDLEDGPDEEDFDVARLSKS